MRRKFLLSRKTRFVPRFSSKHVIVQFIEARPEGDYTIVSAHSRELMTKYGWQGGGKNIPASYLTGLLGGLRALAKGVKVAILDVGLHIPSKGSRPFAAAKGAIDAGIHIPINDEVLPSEERIKGNHIAAYAKILSNENPELYLRHFSHYLSTNLKPEDLPEHFERTKELIIKSFRH
jgi:large subunit ribosomal protein L18